MRLLRRYIASTVAASILMVLCVILGLDIIAAILEELGELKGNYDFPLALRFVLLSVPGSIFDYLPFAALVGCLAGLGTLANNSELVVIRSTGVSTSRIVWMVMRPTIAIMLAGMLISEYVAPFTQNIAQSERAFALRDAELIVSREGLWHREQNQFMHFDVVQANGHLYGIKILSFDEQQHLTKTLYAERAIYQRDHWLMEDITESTITPEQIHAKDFSSMQWQTGLTPDLLNILVLNPDDLSIEGLWNYSRYLNGQGLNSGPYLLAFWKKVLQPISTLSLVLVAISFIFGPLREVTMGYRIFIGVLVGIVFRTIQDMLAPASMVYGFAPMYASLVPIIICTFMGLFFLRRSN